MDFLHGVTDWENCMRAAVVEVDGRKAYWLVGQQRLIWKTEKLTLST